MSNQKILIVDDDEAVSTVVKITLQHAYDVATTTSALSALKYLGQCKVDLVILDINMPGMNGIEALREIKKGHPNTTVIMLTAYASHENVQKAKILGAHGFIIKPFEVGELRSYVNTVFSQDGECLTQLQTSESPSVED